MSGYLNGDDCDLAVFCAFRYALGRSTYITEDISDLIINNIDNIEAITKCQIASEIVHALDTNNAGMKCDRYSWEKVYRKITGRHYIPPEVEE